MENYLDEAQVLVNFIKSKLTELEALGSDDVVPDHSGAGTLCRGDNDGPDNWDAPDDGDDPNVPNNSNVDRMQRGTASSQRHWPSTTAPGTSGLISRRTTIWRLCPQR
jgi:hypothetical protein